MSTGLAELTAMSAMLPNLELLNLEQVKLKFNLAIMWILFDWLFFNGCHVNKWYIVIIFTFKLFLFI